MALTIVDNTARAPQQHPGRQPPPPVARSAEETGLPFLFLAQLVSKHLLNAGQQDLAQLSTRIRLWPRLVEQILEFLRREHLCEVASTSTGSHRGFVLTETGRQRAIESLRLSHYAGPAPVTLQAYVEQVRRQSVADLRVTREDMSVAFRGVTAEPELLDQLGTAMNSGRALFLYGPAGSGKTFIAERLARLLADPVFVPHAIYVHDQVIQMFDPRSHEPVEAQEPERASMIYASTLDQRWVLCRRPVVMAGGELTLDMLDLQFDGASRFYAAPPQLKANNGLLIIDDLGRQIVPAQDLMNRWIVPLDRRIDFLGLHTGEKFTVPFDATVVFSTNMTPSDLADEAFLRRLGYKIRIGAIEADRFREICRQECEAMDIDFSEPAIDYLCERFSASGRPMLACMPRDLISQVRDQARYERVPPHLCERSLSRAWDSYFVRDPAGAIAERR